MKPIFEQLIITYQTSELPPPFSYHLEIKCYPLNNHLEVDFSQKYVDRDQVEEEEILAEGFSHDDDFHWQGKLPAVWLSHLQKEAEQLKLSNERSSLHLELISDQGKQSGYPKNIKDWEYLIQELTQAVFEESKKEMPLQMGLMVINEDKKRKTQWLEYSFANFAISDENGKPVMEWQKGQNLLQLIFMLDFDEPTVNPPPTGIYIDPGEGLWYRLGQGANNPHPKNDVQSKLASTVKKLLK